MLSVAVKILSDKSESNTKVCALRCYLRLLICLLPKVAMATPWENLSWGFCGLMWFFVLQEFLVAVGLKGATLQHRVLPAGLSWHEQVRAVTCHIL